MAKQVILCVDDEKIVLDSLQEQLESRFGKQFNYEIAESADEAWEVIEDLESDDCIVAVVISDWLMPRTKGDAFLCDVHAKFPKTVTIMLTGQAEPEAVQNAIDNANLYAYVKKPWNSEDLMNRIKLAIDNSKSVS